MNSRIPLPSPETDCGRLFREHTKHNKMKTLQLWVNGEGWREFQYENLVDIAAEFEKRGISIGSGASIGYGARIGSGASIGDGARIGSGASIGYGARIGSGASIGYGASIGDGARIIFTLCFNGSRHNVIYWGEDRIQIGCKDYSISHWQEHLSSIGENQGYSPDQILEYKQYIDIISEVHKRGINKLSE